MLESVDDTTLRETTMANTRTVGEITPSARLLQRPDRPVVGTWFWGTRTGGVLQAADDAAEARFFPLDEPPSDLAFDGDKLLIEKLKTEREH